MFVFVSEHLCVCKDPLKADACFEHVVESLRGPSLCAYVCVCERGARGTQVDDLRRGSST